MTCESYMKFRFHCPQVKFYWNLVTFIPLHSNCATLAELSGCSRDSVVYKL